MSEHGRGDPAAGTGGSGRPSALLRAKEIFLRVRVLPAAERASQLEALCGGDADVRRLVEQLLAGEDAPLPFETLADEVVAARDAMARQSESGIAEEQPGTRIGPYRVLEKIGEGGFGVVYLAEQEEPVRRRLALKILKLGMDTRQIVARFEAERQALAIMDHPGIARVFDAGATRTGRPYFVMELVEGEPITGYCDRHALSIEQRLVLFCLVCEAVQHAHQKGVIHRDIKPSNILVTEVDGRAMPKVIDFGIAKAIDEPLAPHTLITEHGRFIGTPEYISPEQATGSKDLDTRTDVYSLGVLLYEMLVGTTPFSSKELRSAAVGEIQRIIREVDPPKPSTRLSRAEATISDVASRRQTAPERLGRAVQGDLDWIVMRAIEKDRGRRYDSPSAIAMDIRRHLNAQPVEAAPPGTAYRLRKFARRHKVGVAAGSVVLAAVLLGIAGTSAGLVWALREREAAENSAKAESQQRALAQGSAAKATEEAARAEKEKAEAQTAREKAELVASFMSDLFGGVGPSFARGRDTTMLRELMTQAADRVESGELKDAPSAELAVRQNIGAICTEIGAYEQARKMLEPGLDLAKKLHAEDHESVAESLMHLGALMQATGELERAERLYQDALDMRERLYTGKHRLKAGAIIALGYTKYLRGDVSNGEMMLFRGLAMHRDAKPQDKEGLVRAFNALSEVLRARGDFNQAMLTAQSGLGMCRSHFPADHPLAVVSMVNMAGALKGLGDDAGAERVLFQAREMDKRLREIPPAANVAEGGGGGGGGGGVPVNPPKNRGDPAYAERILRQNLDAARRSNPGNHPATANLLQSLAMVLKERGQAEEAGRLLDACVQMRRALYPNGHNETVSALRGLAAMKRAAGDLESAEKLYREMLSIQSRLRPGPNADTSATMFLLGDLLEQKGDAAGAEQFFTSCQQMSMRLWVIAPQIGRAAYRLGLLAEKRGDHAAAEPLFRQAVEKHAAAFGPEHAETRAAKRELGATLLALGKHDEAAKVLREVLASEDQTGGGDGPAASAARVTLGRVLIALRQFDAAEAQLLRAERALSQAGPEGMTEAQGEQLRRCREALADLRRARE